MYVHFFNEVFMLNKIYKKLLKLSLKASKEGEVPVAAVLVYDNKIVASAYNKRNASNCVFDHAEIICIRKFSRKYGDWRLNKCSLYVTIEPCEMCKMFIMESRIHDVYFMFNKLGFKKQYSNCNFNLIEKDNFNSIYFDNYKKILDLFWKNRR